MNRAAPQSQRFFGVQWRLLLTHVTVAIATTVLAVSLMLLPFVRERGLGGIVLAGSMAMLVATLAGAWIGLRSARGVKMRLREASRFAAALARGDYRQRINLWQVGDSEQYDEIDQLGDELNSMADNLEAAIQDLRGLAERNRSLAEEAGRLAALEERTKLARDLHDTVNQQVFSLSMQAAAARRRLETAAEESTKAPSDKAGAGKEALAEVETLLGEVEALARSAHRQMRDLILQLRPTTLEQQGLGPALEEYARTFAEAAGLRCSCGVDCSGRFGLAVEEALFRIAQEALNNVAKHSKATKVEVRLALESPPGGPSRQVVLRVQDDGCGFDPNSPVRVTALGLRGLRERAAALGGRVKVKSSPGRGTTVEASFPAGCD